MSGFCPNCGANGSSTEALRRGEDADGRPLRDRRCVNCHLTFSTVEAPMPVRMRAFDDLERLRRGQRPPRSLRVRVDVLES